MISSIGTFADSTFKFTKNPLGIIGLFIVLLYGFASLVLGFSNNLDSNQRWPLIWFLIIFPVMILISFIWLVINHHTKLYSPNDFRTDDSFIRLSTPEEQKTQKYEEYKNQDEPAIPDIVEGEHRQNSIRVLMNKAILSEELVMRQLESEFGKSFKRNVRIGNSLPIFDGVFISEKEVIAIEVKFYKKIYVGSIKQVVQRLETIAHQFKINYLNKPFSILLAIVTEEDFNQNNILNTFVDEQNKNSPVKIELRFFKFNELQDKFGI
jgi:hypothetical protein